MRGLWKILRKLGYKEGFFIKISGLVICSFLVTLFFSSFLVQGKSSVKQLPIKISKKKTINSKDTFRMPKISSNARIIFLHHSTGGRVWNAGVPELMSEFNKKNGKNYQISEQNYPTTDNGYPWSNYPYDYYNLWVKHKNSQQDKKELNLDQIAAKYDVIIFKHCFPVGSIQDDTGKPDINSSRKSLENYILQYNALKERIHEFPNKVFIVWTGAVLSKDSTTSEQASRAKQWANWVRSQWDTPGDNIFVFDFEKLETEGDLYFKYPSSNTDSHPNNEFSKKAASEFIKRIFEVLNGNVVTK